MLALAAGMLGLSWFVPELRAIRAKEGLVLAGFPLLIAVACFSPICRPLVIRFIAWVVLVFCLTVVGIAGAGVHTITDLLPWETAGLRLIRCLALLVVIGVPSASVAWSGRYPEWGRHAFAFRDPSLNPKEDQ